MRFSLATLIPLAALAVPALSTSVQARDGSDRDVDHKGKDNHRNDGGSKDYNYGNKDHGRKDCTWEPVFEHKKDFRGWNKGKYTPYDHKDVKKDTYEIECKDFCEKDDKCNSCQVYSKEESEEKFICELFEEIIDILTWEDDCDDDKDRKDGKDRKDEKDRKDRKMDDKKDDKDGKKDRKDNTNRKDDKDCKDRHKYYDTSCWNAHYNY
ncbi:uncharacterized protein EV420DRAFT_1765293 [Desarmillaria tabescens]|uniref:Apple domain-containing protein n=1 Tax=Armillaria tabescens TaxID=1929756 RepID=A0AA39K6S4_ARMTA|nr:uncharacterized protein EV420DRAFT_1765293 [Desarmillaria tabescens]KAK0455624.1 hypothetical protein EV420DRAFT_1765293 [Desarmillaria tabescens]